jgi:autotransporter-associated beta strand protein
MISSKPIRNRRAALATCLLTLTAFAATLPARAAVVTFSNPANCTADTDVKLSGGAQLFAYTWGGAATVNGLPFVATAATVQPGAYLMLSSFTAANATVFTMNAAPFSSLSGSYSNILRGSVYNGAVSTTATATLTNLVPGHTYFVQFWIGDPRGGATTNRVVDVSSGGGPVVRVDFNVGNAGGGVGQYIYATFVADNANQDILLDGSQVVSPDAGVPQINAIQLRDITGVWSGTTSGAWNDNDATTLNFSGLNYTAVKAVATNVYFGDLDASGNAVATSTITVGAGGVAGANANFNNSTLAYTLNSADATGITGAYGVTVSGASKVALNGANTYSGNTTVNAGTLALGNSGAVSGSAAIVLNGGALDSSALSSLTLGASQALRGNGTINGSVTAAAGSTLTLGTAGTAGMITVTTNLTLNGQALAFDLPFAPFGNDKLVVGNTLTLNGTCTISLNYLSGQLAGGTYTLVTYGSKAGAGTFVLDTTYPGVTLNVNPTSVTLTVAGGGGTSSAWTNLLGGTWGTAANWSGNVIATNVDGVADFSTLDITAARTVTNDTIRTIGHLVFGDTVQNANWTLSAGTNILAVSSGSPKIIVNGGQSATISSSLAGSQGFTKLGAGTLNLNAANTITNGVNILAGALNLQTATALGSTANPALSPVVISNALVQFSTSGAQFFTNNLILLGTSNTVVQNSGAQDNFVGTITGSGILRISTPGGVVIGQRGDMSGFTGTVLVTGNAAGNNASGLILANGDSVSGISGSANAVFDFEGGTLNYLYSAGTINATNYMGALVGSNANVIVQTKNGAGTTSGDVTSEIGALNQSTYFMGSFRDYANANTGTTPPKLGIRKVGTGTLTLAGASTNTGPTEVWNGALDVSGSLGASPITVKSGAALLLEGTIGSPTVTVQSGGRWVVGGSATLGSAILSMNGSMDVTAGAGYFSLGSATLSGTGVVNGGLTMSGGSTLNPGPIGGAGTLTLSNGTYSVYGGTLAFDLSNTPLSGNDLLDVKGNLDLSSPGVTVSINKLMGALGGGTYLLAQCSGTLSGSVANLTLVGANPLDYLRFNGNRLELVVSAVTSLTWKGDNAANLWDIGASTTWLNGSTPATYANGNSVMFDNTGGTNPVVNIPADVAPAIVTVAGSSNYTFTGAGAISGGAALVKNGASTLTVLNTNSFSGDVFLNSGTLAIGNGVKNGQLSADITNNAALVYTTPLDQVMSNSVSGPGSLTKLGAGALILTATNNRTGPTTISAGTLTLGDGSSLDGTLGTGAVTNNGLLAFAESAPFTSSNSITGSGSILNQAVGPVTLQGTISGTGRLTNDTSAGVIFLRGTNTYSGGTWINGGTVVVNDPTLHGAGTGPIVIADGTAALQFSATGTNVVPNSIQLPGGSTADQFSLPSMGTVRLTGLLTGGAPGQVTRFVNITSGGDNRGVIILDNPANSFTTTPETYFGTLAFTSDGALGNATNGISVNVGNKVNTQFYSRADDGLRFDANNVTLNANRLITLVGNENINVGTNNGTVAGPITGSTLMKRGTGTLTVNGAGSLTNTTTVYGGTLLLNNAWAGTTLTVNSGAILGGTGNLATDVSLLSGGTLAPGNGIGTMTIQSNLTLSAGSTTLMEINAGSVTCDKVVGLSSVSYGGTLSVVNTGGALAIGQSFQLFSSAAASNNFSALSLPALGSGLAWQWTPANGTLAVVGGGVATNPTNITATVSGGALHLSWPADHTGWRLVGQTNSIGVGLATNWYTVPGSTNVNSVSVPINPANPAVFFRLVYP